MQYSSAMLHFRGITKLVLSLCLLFPISLYAEPAPLLIPPDRSDFIASKYASNEPSWQFLQEKANAYLSLSNSAYGISEKAATLALAYRVSGRADYRDRAMDMFMAFFINGSFNYQGRNDFRWHGPWAFLTYTWLYNDWSVANKVTIINEFNTWAQYWVTHSAPPPVGSTHFRIGDSDHISFLSEIFLMMAVSLENEDATTRVADTGVPLAEVIIDPDGTEIPTSSILFAKSDWILNDMVVAQYMNDWMEGGLWSEGTDYSPGTMEHWMRAYLINKEIRNISFPNNYYEDVLYSTIYSTYPAYNGIYQYRDIEQVAAYGDYRPPAGDYRYDMMLHILAMLDNNSNSKALAQFWINAVTEKNPNAPAEANEVWRFLFEGAGGATAQSPENLALDTTFIAEGEGFVSTRTGWGENASVLFFLNSKNYVDHEHADALSFDIVHKNAVITKEMTGYRLNATDSPPFTGTAHNTLLIENESPDGSSNPRGRGEGDGVNRVVSSTREYTYIEADATKVYNRGEGYMPDIYADNVVRKIAFLKEKNIVIVYDNIVILPDASPRWTKYIQHFQEEPVEENNVYSASSNGSKIFFKSLYPANVSISKVDESLYWSNASTVEAPLNQRKWHLSITNPDNPDDVEYLNIIYFDDDTVATMPVSALLHSDNGNVSTNNMAGVHIVGAEEDTIALFNNNPNGAGIQSSVSYHINGNNNGTHYLYGMDSNSEFNISVTRNAATTTVTIFPGAGIKPSVDGVLSFNIAGTTIVDNTPPVITLRGSNPYILTIGGQYIEPGATAQDDIDGDITNRVVIDASAVNTQTVGSYIVRYNVSDSSGNQAAEVVRTVNVVDASSDITPPTITLNGPNPYIITVGGDYEEPGATARDDADGDITNSIVVDVSAVNTQAIGSYVVRYNVSDSSGNQAPEAVRVVNVVAANGQQSSQTKSGGGAVASWFLLALLLTALFRNNKFYHRGRPGIS